MVFILNIGLLVFSIMSCGTSNLKQEKKPRVAFIFDDGWVDHFEVINPVFDERKIKCGFAIVKRLV